MRCGGKVVQTTSQLRSSPPLYYISCAPGSVAPLGLRSLGGGCPQPHRSAVPRQSPSCLSPCCPPHRSVLPRQSLSCPSPHCLTPSCHPPRSIHPATACGVTPLSYSLLPPGSHGVAMSWKTPADHSAAREPGGKKDQKKDRAAEVRCRPDHDSATSRHPVCPTIFDAQSFSMRFKLFHGTSLSSLIYGCK